ncbi:MAG: alcohol dehydrogenase catalytic domain-containing protein [Gammaproteobacteria bacterium]|nr:alcohol dehydrogenase catalytic domain-containing protein [Gammaproteobacteria bacterium]
MLAGVFEGPGEFHVREVPEPVCPDGGALLAVDACAVCGTDVRIARFGHAKVAPPQVLGHEVVGRVVDGVGLPRGSRAIVAPAIGCGHCRWCVAGRPNRCPELRTIGYWYPGAFAPLLAVPPEAIAQGSLIAVPDELPDTVACLTEPLACCLNGQELAGVGEGDRVVIVGAGPIGCLHARLAGARGAAQVVIVEARADRRETATALGLGEVLDPAADDVRDAVIERTGGGADVVLLAAPVPALQAEALDWLATGGRLSWFAGLPPDSSAVRLVTNPVHYRELTIVGAHGSTPAQNRAALELHCGPGRWRSRRW